MADRDTSAAGFREAIEVSTPRERFAIAVFDRLWERYRQRVEYVAAYERVVRETGGAFVNDHIAFRTFACQRPQTGVAGVSRIWEALGYVPAGCYHFPDKHLAAIHFQHANPGFPKLFVSELRVWELGREPREIIARYLADHHEPFPLESLVELAEADDSDAEPGGDLLAQAVSQFHELPWPLPEKDDVLALAEESQYAAWTLVHGYNVNHFTSLINSQGVPELGDIEKTVAALRNAGVPMKEGVEGAPGSKLRQTATAAATIDVAVRDRGAETTMPWTYAYFELAERGEVTDPDTGRPVRFEGFLGPQATNLFEMTRVR